MGSWDIGFQVCAKAQAIHPVNRDVLVQKDIEASKGDLLAFTVPKGEIHRLDLMTVKSPLPISMKIGDDADAANILRRISPGDRG